MLIICYRALILQVILCECETWSGALREEHQLQELEYKST